MKGHLMIAVELVKVVKAGGSRVVYDAERDVTSMRSLPSSTASTLSGP
jgi:hypothetical protein